MSETERNRFFFFLFFKRAFQFEPTACPRSNHSQVTFRQTVYCDNYKELFIRAYTYILTDNANSTARDVDTRVVLRHTCFVLRRGGAGGQAIDSATMSTTTCVLWELFRCRRTIRRPVRGSDRTERRALRYWRGWTADGPSSSSSSVSPRRVSFCDVVQCLDVSELK